MREEKKLRRFVPSLQAQTMFAWWAAYIKVTFCYYLQDKGVVFFCAATLEFAGQDVYPHGWGRQLPEIASSCLSFIVGAFRMSMQRRVRG